MIFDYLAHFQKYENFGEPEEICGFLLLTIDQIRAISGWRMHILSGTLGGHSPTGYHPRKLAVDFHFLPIEMWHEFPPIWEQAERLEKILEELQIANFVGLGVYPDWSKAGFHIDCRGERARWGAKYVMVDVNGQKTKLQKYIGYEEALEYAKQKGGNNAQS